MMTWNFSSRTLCHDKVVLEPLEMRLFEETCQSLLPDPDGWYSVMFGLNTREAYKKEFDDAEIFQKNRSGLGFAIRDVASGEIAGISFFLKMDEENRSLEIGTTNIAPRFRKTYVNTAAKYLMLEEAFETLKCIRVSFRVDEENKISATSLEKIGASYGGLLRYERILPDGRVRNYRFYSIVDAEWPAIKSRLASKIQRYTQKSTLTIYAMVGPMGSGKTTLALKIAEQQGALFQSLDGTIKSFNQPIGDLNGYERFMPKALDLMFSRALEALKNGQSVVFDIGRWPWLKGLADVSEAKIEIYYFEISAEERWRRVQKRNEEKPENIYHFTMSKEEFDAQNFRRQLPPPMPGLTVIKVTE